MKLIEETIKAISPPDSEITGAAKRRMDSLTKPLGSLGRLEDLAVRLCGITGRLDPLFRNKVIFTLAADHGVTAEGISPYPKEVTAQMVHNFLTGGAAINVLAAHSGARVVVADFGVACDLRPAAGLAAKKIKYGTENMVKGRAMSRDEAVRSLSYGIELFEDEYKRGVDLAGTGEMGIGNTTASSAITAVLTGLAVEKVTGRGAGLDEKGLQRKIGVIKKAIAVNAPDPCDPLDVLAKVGGLEIGGLAGVILAASRRRVPVFIDGFISGAAALLAFRIEPKSAAYMIAAHKSVENGHSAILKQIGIEPLLDLGMRLGEGTGAALAMGLAEASVKVLNGMATFSSAGVSEKSDV
ncbi:MAG: nicotinate-nucleotide--dimethylbenzimidazole phosphoribosyltransferase [Candidatus Omnitrophota bacterium]|jgi:nicotinate-nucleotide--dimethylbenzimidazole phosphoribosyltransferase